MDAHKTVSLAGAGLLGLVATLVDQYELCDNVETSAPTIKPIQSEIHSVPMVCHYCVCQDQNCKSGAKTYMHHMSLIYTIPV